MKTKNILLTFDYELFLGSRSGSVLNSLIEPTNLLLKIISNLDIKCIFFIDCAYLLKLDENKKNNDLIKNDYQLIINQLKELHLNGHYIYPHIHPHWLHAIYNDKLNEWDLTNTNNYSFDSLKQTQKEKIFSTSLNLLNEIFNGDDNYKIEGYRAGGWCIQPFNNFFPFFKKYGIYADFSVLPGSIADTDVWKFDFSNVSINSKPYYFFDNECEINNNGKFIEFPISSLKIKNNRLIDRVLNYFLWRTNIGKSFGDGVGVKVKNYRVTKPEEYVNQMCSLENLTSSKLFLYKNFIKENNYMHFISHPKMISNHNLYNFKKFLKYAVMNFQINFDWKKYKF